MDIKWTVTLPNGDEKNFTADVMNIMADGSIQFFNKRIGNDLEIKGYDLVSAVASGTWVFVYKNEVE